MSNPQKKSLSPSESITFITAQSTNSIRPSDIDKRTVGVKAWGLACLPKEWTLPFFVISSDLIDDVRSGQNIQPWVNNIEHAASLCGITVNTSILIRSSAPNESMLEHGKYITLPGTINSITSDLNKYIQKLEEDSEIKNESFPLIIQVLSKSPHKGHLSNERRCYKEARDWQGQFESRVANPDFQINLRNWRQEINLSERTNNALECRLLLSIPNVLKNAAAWGFEFDSRLHYEWVWNGTRVYIVQVEEEVSVGDFTPSSLTEKPANYRQMETLKVLQPITREHAAKFCKIHNVYVYMDLSLGSIPLFALDDRVIIENIAKGNFSEDLCDDLKLLSARSLVIRTDINSNIQAERQMLPRTNEVRSFQEAKDWLQKSCSQILKDHSQYEVAFIFHNFIPSVASAFAFAAPGKRKVEIESLWGIPEGLYYNSHDKYIVDTQSSSLNSALKKSSSFIVKKKPSYKPFCYAADDNGRWKQMHIKPPFDWKESIPHEEWITRVALESRKIAEKEGKSVSIMWFIGVPDWASDDPVLPWFHEGYNIDKIPRSKNRRPKTPFEQYFTVSTAKDLELLEDEVNSGNSQIRQILVKPKEEKLLRDKLTLKRIGDVAVKSESVILLEGATLSHAFYQLQETGASIHVENTFERDEEVQEFHKLVRDKIPQNIIAGGELVNTQHLSGEHLTKALREKLVEEAVEVLDATDHDSILSEIADVLEVIDGLIEHLEVDKADIEHKKQLKLDKAGGFKNGIILLKTSNPSPSSNPERDPNFNLELNLAPQLMNTRGPLKQLVPQLIKKKTDKRSHNLASESILTLELPIIIDEWEADGLDIEFLDSKKSSVKAKIKGTRVGSKLRVELSIHNSIQQLDLLSDN